MKSKISLPSMGQYSLNSTHAGPMPTMSLMGPKVPTSMWTRSHCRECPRDIWAELASFFFFFFFLNLRISTSNQSKAGNVSGPSNLVHYYGNLTILLNTVEGTLFRCKVIISPLNCCHVSCSHSLRPICIPLITIF